MDTKRTMCEDTATDNSDLIYNAKERTTTAYASRLVQVIYGLLYDNPQGMTAYQIHESLRNEWINSDTYRAYQEYRRRSKLKEMEYGTSKFMERAERWKIKGALNDMRSGRTARREGRGKDAVYFAGERSPKVPMDVQKFRELAKSTNEVHVRREEIKVLLLEGINDKRISRRDAQEIMQRTYDYLSGR
jgi:hypothetical protein